MWVSNGYETYVPYVIECEVIRYFNNLLCCVPTQLNEKVDDDVRKWEREDRPTIRNYKIAIFICTFVATFIIKI